MAEPTMKRLTTDDETSKTSANPNKKKPVRRSDEGIRSKKESDRQRGKTRVSIGVALPRWRALKRERGLRGDTDVALFLLDCYERFGRGASASTPVEHSDQPAPAPAPSISSSGAESDGVHTEYLFMSSSTEAEQETSDQNGKEQGNKDATCQRPKSQEERTTTKQSENIDNRVEDEDEEFSTTLSVGDGRHLVDLGSSSEFIVDEECILQLFKSCRECSRQCTVGKQVKGLKLVVYQTCGFCQSRCKWTNLPDDDDDKDDCDFHTNGKDVVSQHKAAQTRIFVRFSSNIKHC